MSVVTVLGPATKEVNSTQCSQRCTLRGYDQNKFLDWVLGALKNFGRDEASNIVKRLSAVQGSTWETGKPAQASATGSSKSAGKAERTAKAERSLQSCM